MTTPLGAGADATGGAWHRRTLHRLIAVWKWVTTREQLNRIQPKASATRRSLEIARWFLKPERLPRIQEDPGRGRLSLHPWFTATENLAQKPSAIEAAERPFFRWLATREKLRILQEPSSTTQAKPFFIWLLIPEPLQHVTEATSTREAPHHEP